MNMDAHGYRWKDTYPGVWTAHINLFGSAMLAYAVEVTDDDGQWVLAHPGHSDDAEEFMRRYWEAAGHDHSPSPVFLAGKPHLIFVV